MALDTRERRNSGLVLTDVYELAGIDPDGSDLNTAAERQAGAMFYSGISSGATVSTGFPKTTFVLPHRRNTFVIE